MSQRLAREATRRRPAGGPAPPPARRRQGRPVAAPAACHKGLAALGVGTVLQQCVVYCTQPACMHLHPKMITRRICTLPAGMGLYFSSVEHMHAHMCRCVYTYVYMYKCTRV